MFQIHILLFGPPRGAHSFIPARSDDTPLRAGAVKAGGVYRSHPGHAGVALTVPSTAADLGVIGITNRR